ncbi:DNA-binding protein [Methylobacterium sp.]|uniref:DNA-binding protein n=1 Tax=Methylobacterium sp. TaxID=409 RepID=UPI003B02D552
MVNRNEVVAIADRLHAAGKRVSVRAVREGLRRGGSFGDVGPMVADWKLANNWRTRPVQEDLPDSRTKDPLSRLKVPLSINLE